VISFSYKDKRILRNNLFIYSILVEIHSATGLKSILMNDTIFIKGIGLVDF